MQAQAIRSSRLIGTRPTLDLRVDHPDHNYYAEGVVVSNSHAASYAYLTAATTYLKTVYPLEYYLTMLRLAADETKPLDYMKAVINEASTFGIEVLPPNILTSESDFSLQVDPNDSTRRVILFGLSHIKGISDKTMEALTSFKREFTTKFEVFDAARAAGVDIRVLSSLIYSGCLTWKGTSRTKLALEAQTYNLLSDTQKGKIKSFASEFNEDILAILKALPTKLTEKGKPIIPDSQVDTLRKKYTPYWEAYLQNSGHELLTSYLKERELLGFSYTSTLYQCFSAKVPTLITVDEVKKRGAAYKEVVGKTPEGEKPPYPNSFQFVSFVEWTKEGVSKGNGSPYLKLGLADDSGDTVAMLYGEEKMGSCKSFNGALPEEGDIVICTGVPSKDGQMVFLESCIVQHNPVATKKTVQAEAVTV